MSLKTDAALLDAVRRMSGCVFFTYEPRGKHARLTESSYNWPTANRRKLHRLAKRGFVDERLHGEDDPPFHRWTFHLTEEGTAFINRVQNKRQ